MATKPKADEKLQEIGSPTSILMTVRRCASSARLRGNGPESKDKEKLYALVGDYLSNDVDGIMRSMADHFEYTLARTKCALPSLALAEKLARSRNGFFGGPLTCLRRVRPNFAGSTSSRTPSSRPQRTASATA
jgi:hypothetical protein